MPSVGSMLVGIRAETAELRADLEKNKAELAKFKEAAKKTADEVEDIGHKGHMSGQLITRASREAAQGMALLSGEAKGTARVMSDLVGHGLHGFMHGGVIGLGIAAGAVLMGALGEHTAEAGEQAKKAQEKYDKWLESIKKKAEEAKEGLEHLYNVRKSLELKAQGIDIGAEFLDKGDQAKMLAHLLQDAEDRIAYLKSQLGVGKPTNDPNDRGLYPFGPQGGQSMTVWSRRQREYKEAQEAIEKEIKSLEEVNRIRESTIADLREQLKVHKDINKETERQKDVTKDLKESQKELSEWVTEVEKNEKDFLTDWDKMVKDSEAIDKYAKHTVDHYTIQKEMADALVESTRDHYAALGEVNVALEHGVDLIQAQEIYEAVMAARAAERAKKAREDAAEKAQKDAEKELKAIEKEAKKELTEFLQFFESVENTIASGLADAIVDGIQTGGKNALNIFRNIVNQLLSMVIQSGLKELMSSVLGGMTSSGGTTGVFGVLASAIGLGSSLAGGGGGSPLGGSSAPDFSWAWPAGTDPGSPDGDWEPPGLPLKQGRGIHMPIAIHAARGESDEDIARRASEQAYQRVLIGMRHSKSARDAVASGLSGSLHR